MRVNDFNFIDFTRVKERLENEKNKYKKKKWVEMRKSVNLNSQEDTNIFGALKKTPSLEYIVKVAKMTGKPVDYFLYGNNLFIDKEDKPKLIEIPRIKSYLDKDFNLIYEKNVHSCFYDYRWLKVFVNEPLDLVCMVIHGDSMVPTLVNGDSIQINKGKTTPEDSAIFAFHYHNSQQILIRKFTFELNKIEIIADNPIYKPCIIKKEDIIIIGQIVMSKRLFVMINDNF